MCYRKSINLSRLRALRYILKVRPLLYQTFAMSIVWSMKLKAQIRGVTYGKDLTRYLKKIKFSHKVVFRVPQISLLFYYFKNIFL